MAKELKFTEAQLAEAINNVQCFSDLGADLIAKQVFADALESSAAPVGEREAFEAWTRKEYAFDDDMLRKSNEGHYPYAKPANMWDAYQAGAAHQRQQAREVVMPERKECDDGYPSDDWLCVTAWNACLDEFARLNAGKEGA